MGSIPSEVIRLSKQLKAKKVQNATVIMNSMDSEYHCTDEGNARRLVNYHQGQLLFISEKNEWYIWDGKRYTADKKLQVSLLASEIPQKIALEAESTRDISERIHLTKWALASESAKSQQAMIHLAKPLVAKSIEDLDVDPYWFNVENGTIDLRTGKLFAHQPTQLLTKLAPVAYHEGAESPLWNRFLVQIMNGNQALITLLQRIAGYTMIGTVSEEKIVFLYGTGANGKSVFLNVLLKIFGNYGQPTDPDLLVTTRGEHHPTGIANLVGVRLAVSNELEEGQLLREALLKKLTGGDPISARFMHQNFFTFKPSHTLFMASNHKPIIRGQDEGIWRRILMIPFLHTIPEHDRDRQLMEKLMAEAPGILRWLVEGCLAWQRNGLEIPAEVRYAVGVYREDSDPLADFIEGKCVIHPGGIVTKVELYQAYAAWGKENGMPIINQKAFFNLILQKYPHIEQKRSATQRYWQGIMLKPSDTMTECDTKINNTHENNRDEQLKIVSSDVIRHSSPSGEAGTRGGEYPIYKKTLN